MDIRVRTTSLGRLKADALVLPVFEGENLKRALSAVGKTYVGAWETLKEREVFLGNLLVLR